MGSSTLLLLLSQCKRRSADVKSPRTRRTSQLAFAVFSTVSCTVRDTHWLRALICHEVTALMCCLQLEKIGWLFSYCPVAKHEPGNVHLPMSHTMSHTMTFSDLNV